MHILPTLNIGAALKTSQKHLGALATRFAWKIALTAVTLAIINIALKRIFSNASSLFKSCPFLPARVVTFFDYTVESTKNIWIIFKISEAFSFALGVPQKYTNYACLIVRDLIDKIRQEKEINALRLANSQLTEISKQFEITNKSLDEKLLASQESLRLSEANNAALKDLLETIQANEGRLSGLLQRVHLITRPGVEASSPLDYSLLSALSSEIKAKLNELVEIETRIAKQKEACATAEVAARTALIRVVDKMEDSNNEFSKTVNDLKEVVKLDQRLNEKKEDLRARSAAILARVTKPSSVSEKQE